MGLLADNQPWNLILFMAIPVILAETIAIAELYLLYTRNYTGRVRLISRVAGMCAGVYMVGVFGYILTTAAIPLSTSGGWRGIADIVAVSGYLLSAIPLIGIGALEFGLLGRGKSEAENMKLHAVFVAVFLVFAHAAMIFGMLDPTILGWSDGAVMDGVAHMTEMSM